MAHEDEIYKYEKYDARDSDYFVLNKKRTVEPYWFFISSGHDDAGVYLSREELIKLHEALSLELARENYNSFI